MHGSHLTITPICGFSPVATKLEQHNCIISHASVQTTWECPLCLLVRCCWGGSWNVNTRNYVTAYFPERYTAMQFNMNQQQSNHSNYLSNITPAGCWVHFEETSGKYYTVSHSAKMMCCLQATEPPRMQSTPRLQELFSSELQHAPGSLRSDSVPTTDELFRSSFGTGPRPPHPKGYWILWSEPECDSCVYICPNE